MLRQIFWRIRKQRNISSEFINDHAEKPISIGRVEKCPGPHNLSKDPAAFNIGNQKGSAIQVMDRPQIHEVTAHQIELYRTTRTLQNQDVTTISPILQGVTDD